jgi:hypothetical protein
MKTTTIAQATGTRIATTGAATTATVRMTKQAVS